MIEKISAIVTAGVFLTTLASASGPIPQRFSVVLEPDPAVAQHSVKPENEPKLSSSQTIKLLQQKVKYVFVLYQENRSFDSYFGTFPGAEGIYSHTAKKTPGFTQTIINTDGSAGTIQPFRIDPTTACGNANPCYSADTDDIDHSHPRMVAKMNVVNGVSQMNKFALVEEEKYMGAAGVAPSLKAKQMGELAMAYMDGDTIPFLWQYANRFVLFDHIFQSMTGPSTPGNLAIIAAQSGQTQAALHLDDLYTDNGGSNPGQPVLNDNDPFWGSPSDTHKYNNLPVNPGDFPGYGIALNQTYASLPLTLLGNTASSVTSQDADTTGADTVDVMDDIANLTKNGKAAVSWGWYEEGFDNEPGSGDATHTSYITHHNGPQYFGYVANNSQMTKNLHGLTDFFNDVNGGKLPAGGGVFYVKGGYTNIFGLKPANPDPTVQKNFLGDDDHPAYADAQISEALVAKAVNAVANSQYWPQCAIIITWDDSEGDYDHVPPPIRSYGPDGSVVTDGPRVPLIVISPYARVNHISQDTGTQGSVVKFVDTVFGLTPLASLPDEQEGSNLGAQQFGESNWGPDDADPSVSNLVSAFDPGRLKGSAKPLDKSYAIIDDSIVSSIPPTSNGQPYGLKQIGITPTDAGMTNHIPADFNPRPKTNPTP